MAELEIGSYEKRQNGIEAEFYSLEMLNKDKKKMVICGRFTDALQMYRQMS